MAGNHVALPLAASELAGACVLAALLRAALTVHQLRALPEARREARTDPLTDLANRRHLHERCAHLLARPEAAPVTVLMIDLNGFKKVNDRHGHRVGDALLVQVATRLAAVLRRDDLLGRLGGDEFAALLPTQPPPAHASHNGCTPHSPNRHRRRPHLLHRRSIGISSINPPGSPPPRCSITPTSRCTTRKPAAPAPRSPTAWTTPPTSTTSRAASPTLPPATPRRPGPPPARQLDHQKLGRGRSRAGEAVCDSLTQNSFNRFSGTRRCGRALTTAAPSLRSSRPDSPARRPACSRPDAPSSAAAPQTRRRTWPRRRLPRRSGRSPRSAPDSPKDASRRGVIGQRLRDTAAPAVPRADAQRDPRNHQANGLEQ